MAKLQALGVLPAAPALSGAPPALAAHTPPASAGAANNAAAAAPTATAAPTAVPVLPLRGATVVPAIGVLPLPNSHSSVLGLAEPSLQQRAEAAAVQEDVRTFYAAAMEVDAQQRASSGGASGSGATADDAAAEEVARVAAKVAAARTRPHGKGPAVPTQAWWQVRPSDAAPMFTPSGGCAVFDDRPKRVRFAKATAASMGGNGNGTGIAAGLANSSSKAGSGSSAARLAGSASGSDGEGGGSANASPEPPHADGALPFVRDGEDVITSMGDFTMYGTAPYLPMESFQRRQQREVVSSVVDMRAAYFQLMAAATAMPEEVRNALTVLLESMDADNV